MTAVLSNRRAFWIRLLGIPLLAFSLWMLVRGHQAGAFEVGTRRSSVLVTGPDIWLGYVNWLATAALAPCCFFVQHQHTRLFRVLSAVVGGVWFVTLALCFIKGVPVED